MTATTSTLETSIKALENKIFSCASGFRCDVYLDPVERRVYTFLGNNSAPMDAYHNIDQHILTVQDRAIPSTVVDALMGVIDNLESLCDAYQGTAWDGNNHVGTWAEVAQEITECMGQIDLEVGCFWDPGDWFEPVSSEVRFLLAQGKTPEEVCASIGTDFGTDGAVEEGEAVAWIEDFRANRVDD